jgi:hypothetical protein
MRIEKEYKKSGYFWLPSEQSNKVPGTLSIKDGGEIELEIVGFLGDFRSSFMGATDISRINGDVEDDGAITLDGCFYTKPKFLFGGISKSLIHVNIVFSGWRYEKDETTAFNQLSFSVDGLDEWVQISGIKTEIGIENKSASITYTQPENISINLENGMQLLIAFKSNLPLIGFNLKDASVSQKSYLKLISDDEKEFSEFRDIAYKLVHFLGFAIDSVVTLSDMTAKSEKIKRTFDEGKTSYQIPIKIYYPSIPFMEEVPKVSWPDMLFMYRDIKGKEEHIFNKWIAAYDSISPALNLYFATKSGVYKYVDARFLALVQGIETYQRRTSNKKLMPEDEFKVLVISLIDKCPMEKREWLRGRITHGNEISLGQRIKHIIEPFKTFVGDTPKERKEIIRKITSTRNYLTHYSEDMKPSAATEGNELYDLCLKLEAFFQLQLLILLGFSDNELSKVIDDCYRLKRKLKHK